MALNTYIFTIPIQEYEGLSIIVEYAYNGTSYNPMSSASSNQNAKVYVYNSTNTTLSNITVEMGRTYLSGSNTVFSTALTKTYNSLAGNSKTLYYEGYYPFEIYSKYSDSLGFRFGSVRYELMMPQSGYNYSRVPIIQNIQSFNDEGNIIINYNISSSITASNVPEGTYGFGVVDPNSNEFLLFREVSFINSSGTYNYTIELTEEERVLLQNAYPNAVNNTVQVVLNHSYLMNKYWLTRNGRWVEPPPYIDFTSLGTATFTITDCKPYLNPTIKDILPETLALTGNENYFVRYESMAEFSTGATALKGAEIVSQLVECGSQKVTDMYNGIFDDVETADFLFNATDSRGLMADQVLVSKTLIPYLKPTCYQDLEIGLGGETEALVTLTVTGKCFTGSFGAVNNSILIEVRYGEKSNELGEWMPLNGTLTFENNEYKLVATVGGFEYEKAYTFQCRATDKLNYVQSSQYTIRLLPVYDWSEEDFNFNVPVKMNGETVLRHNATANNTVLSASGGHIYLRPAGTDNTSGETIIYPDGSIKFGGDVEFNGGLEFGEEIEFNAVSATDLTVANSLTINKNPVADYVIETGTEAMGSNGTWYWSKWASGKAECYGRRNFGKLAMTSSTSNGYKSADLSQAFPSGLFTQAPDFLSMSALPNGASAFDYVVVMPSVTTALSASNTGTFQVVRQSSGTATASDISFNVIGRWK